MERLGVSLDTTIKRLVEGELLHDIAPAAKELAQYSHLSEDATAAILVQQGGIPARGPGSKSLAKAAERSAQERGLRTIRR